MMSWLNKPKFRKKVCVNFLGLGFTGKGTTAGVSKETAGYMFKEPLQRWLQVWFYKLLIPKSYLVSSNSFH